MNIPNCTIREDGQTTLCISLKAQCKYNCCRQSLPTEDDFCPDNALLLYPGEFEAASEETRRHIQITMADFNGGKLGYCDETNFDQSNCDVKTNFKPLDCQSYPFAPAIKDGHLILKIDPKRCPLPKKNIATLYEATLRKWKAVIEKNPHVIKWIEKLNLVNYEKYEV